MPGVEGGVKAGETRPGSSELSSEFEEEDENCERCECVWFVWSRELRSSSEMARETGIGRGE